MDLGELYSSAAPSKCVAEFTVQYESANQRGPILATQEDTLMCNETLIQTSSVDLLFW